jgi:hypothetical protein
MQPDRCSRKNAETAEFLYLQAEITLPCYPAILTKVFSRGATASYKAALFRETAFHEPIKNRPHDARKSCIMHASDAG